MRRKHVYNSGGSLFRPVSPSRFHLYVAEKIIPFSNTHSTADYHSLRQSLLSNYDPEAAPAPKVNTEYGLALININDVDSDHFTVDAKFWERIIWNDTRLQWNPSDYESNITSIDLKASEIWTPQVQFYEECVAQHACNTALP